MLTKISDLEHPDRGQPLSPRDWLIAGLDPDPVLLIAPDVQAHAIKQMP